MIFLEGKMEMSFFKLRTSNIPSHVSFMCRVWWPWPNLKHKWGRHDINCYLSICKSGGGQWHYWYYAGSGATLPHGSLAIIIIYAGNTALHLPGGPEAVRETQNFCQNNPGVWTKLIWQSLTVTRSHGRASGGGVGSLTPGTWPGLTSKSWNKTVKFSIVCLLVFVGFPNDAITSIACGDKHF